MSQNGHAVFVLMDLPKQGTPNGRCTTNHLSPEAGKVGSLTESEILGRSVMNALSRHFSLPDSTHWI